MGKRYRRKNGYRRLLLWIASGVLLMNTVMGSLHLTAHADIPQEQEWMEDSFWGESLQEMLAEREVMAVVYLCTEYALREQVDGPENGDMVPCGQTVTIQDVAADENDVCWVKVQARMASGTAEGWMKRENLACSDERFLAWESAYGNILTWKWLTEMEELPWQFFDLGEDPDGEGNGPEGNGEENPGSGTGEGNGPGTLPGGEENPGTLPGEEDPVDYADIERFPENWREALTALKEAHPMWIFVPMNTGLDWNAAVTAQLQNGKSLVHKSLPDCTKEDAYDQGSWFYASREVLAYYMDPRNALTEESIFQFEQLTYNESYHTQEALEAFLQNTFMNSGTPAPGTQMTYAQILYYVGKEEGRQVSPFHLAARIIQEQGQGTSPLISGNYPGYEGYYNYFNIQASGTTNKEVIENGLKYAKNANPPWTDAYFSIMGGADVISGNYIRRGQDTLYLQKYNVNPQSLSPLHTHQYMQNISAPTTESRTMMRLYSSTGALDSTFVFKIPVYNNMPETACPMPTSSTNVVLKIPSGYTGTTMMVDGTVYEAEKRNGRLIATLPNGEAKNAQLIQKNEEGETVKTWNWDLTWKNSCYTETAWPVAITPYTLTLTLPENVTGRAVWLDGVEYQGTSFQGKLWIEAKNQNAKSAVVYQYNASGVPVDMHVWNLKYQDRAYQAVLAPELQNLITYHGFSIRITGKSGIRFKSGIAAETRELLLGDGVDGWHLKEYGTLVMTNSNRSQYPLIRGGEKVASGLSYGKQGDGTLLDNIYETVSGRYRFTSVLVGLPVAQYKTEFAFRGYAVLEKEGQENVIYGPVVARSIYALAGQALGMGSYEEGSDADLFLKKLISDADALENTPEQ